MLAADDAFACQNHGALNHVAQLTDVARPPYPARQRFHVRREIDDAALVALFRPSIGARAIGGISSRRSRKGEQIDLEDIQTEVEIFPERSMPRWPRRRSRLLAATIRTSTSTSFTPPRPARPLCGLREHAAASPACRQAFRQFHRGAVCAAVGRLEVTRATFRRAH